MRQQELASAIDGMSASAWSRVEKGETELTALQLVKVAKVLDTDVNSILEEANHLIEKLRDTNFRVEAMTLKELESDSRKRKLDGVSAAAIAAGAAAISSVAPVVIPVIGIAALAGVISQLFNED
ncbi:MAG: helix-turn-helix transcriptional regulator [Azonexus sp.]|nr:helix-turn-helix transcriptional regulator [Azonexus sp.]